MTDSQSSLELLFNVSRELTSALDLHTVLSRILLLSTQNVGAERGSVVVMDDNREPIDGATIYKGHHTAHTGEPLKVTLTQGLAGWVVAHRAPTLVPDTSLDLRWLSRPEYDTEKSRSKSAICVPILARDELVGVLTLVHAQPNSFGKEHLALLQSIADQAGIAIQNARLFESMHAAQRRYQDLFDDSINPILITNLDGKIQETNRQASIVSGRPRDMLLNSTIWELHSLRVEWLQQNIQEIQAGETVNCETELFPLDRHPIPVEVYAHAFRFGSENLLQWIIRDISERKELDTLRDDLSAMIYHDLRSPLANIISSLDMLQALVPDGTHPGEDPLVSQVVSIAIRSTQRMQRLIDSLLDINRLESGQIITKQNIVDIPTLVYDALAAIEPIIQTKHQIVEQKIDSSLPPIWVDEDMIRRVLINLLDNATKFTPIEGTIQVGAQQENDWVKMWVKDSGPGIPHGLRELIFNKFSHFQVVRMQGVKLPKGLGLGLAFCKLAIQAHGGKIGLESQIGSGSNFFFYVPVYKNN